MAKKQSDQLVLKSYEEFHGALLHTNLNAQYHVTGFPGMLLSPRSWKVGSGRYAVCTHCKSGMKVSQANSKKPPKFAIANGFAIGTFPSRIPYASPSCADETRSIDVRRDVNDVMKTLVDQLDHLDKCSHILGDLRSVFKVIINSSKPIKIVSPEQ